MQSVLILAITKMPLYISARFKQSIRDFWWTFNSSQSWSMSCHQQFYQQFPNRCPNKWKCTRPFLHQKLKSSQHFYCGPYFTVWIKISMASWLNTDASYSMGICTKDMKHLKFWTHQVRQWWDGDSCTSAEVSSGCQHLCALSIDTD